jgi:hypothetical protein
MGQQSIPPAVAVSLVGVFLTIVALITQDSDDESKKYGVAILFVDFLLLVGFFIMTDVYLILTLVLSLLMISLIIYVLISINTPSDISVEMPTNIIWSATRIAVYLLFLIVLVLAGIFIQANFLMREVRPLMVFAIGVLLPINLVYLIFVATKRVKKNLTTI